MAIIKGIIRKEKEDNLFIETTDGDTFLLRKSNVIMGEGNTVEFDDKDIETIPRLPPVHPDGDTIRRLPPGHPDGDD